MLVDHEAGRSNCYFADGPRMSDLDIGSPPEPELRDGYECPDCGGTGWGSCEDEQCCDSGECVHGNGAFTCPRCKGTGTVEDDPEEAP